MCQEAPASSTARPRKEGELRLPEPTCVRGRVCVQENQGEGPGCPKLRKPRGGGPGEMQLEVADALFDFEQIL